jgi:hypothetical protein
MKLGERTVMFDIGAGSEERTLESRSLRQSGPTRTRRALRQVYKRV